jgi:hypothetical protein
MHDSLHRNRDACDRLNGKVLHGKCLRVELSSTSNSQNILRTKSNATNRNPSPPPRRRDTRQPPNYTNNNSNNSTRSGGSSGNGSSSNKKATSVPEHHVPPVAIVVSDSGPRVYNGKPIYICLCIKYNVIVAAVEMMRGKAGWLDETNHCDATVWCCYVCAVGEWGVRITGMARDTTWQEVKNMLLRYADIYSSYIPTIISLSIYSCLAV